MNIDIIVTILLFLIIAAIIFYIAKIIAKKVKFYKLKKQEVIDFTIWKENTFERLLKENDYRLKKFLTTLQTKACCMRIAGKKDALEYKKLLL